MEPNTSTKDGAPRGRCQPAVSWLSGGIIGHLNFRKYCES
jgi:hypothetical protein